MVGTQLVEELVQVCAASYKVMNSQPVSLLLVADRESGKTTITEAAGAGKQIVRVTVTTGIGVVRELDRNKQAHIIVFDDLAILKGLNSRAQIMLVEILNGFTETGVNAIAMPRGKKIDLRGRRGSVIACITETALSYVWKAWRDYGFISRSVIFNYDYSEKIIAEIKNGITNEDVSTLSGPIAMRMPTKKMAVSIPKNFSQALQTIVDYRAEELGEKGIRLLKNYRAILKSRALLHDRNQVNQSDYEFLYRVDQYNKEPHSGIELNSERGMFDAIPKALKRREK